MSDQARSRGRTGQVFDTPFDPKADWATWAHKVVDELREKKGLPPLQWTTRKGANYCHSCLKVGLMVEAHSHKGRKTIFCRTCLLTMPEHEIRYWKVRSAAGNKRCA